MTIELLIDSAPGELRSALREDGETLEIRLHRDSRQQPGAIALARIAALAPAGGGGFLDLGEAGEAFLPEKDCRGVAEGALLPVQIRAIPAEAGKLPVASRRLRLAGRYVLARGDGTGLDGDIPPALAGKLAPLAGAAALSLLPPASTAPPEAICGEAASLAVTLAELRAATGRPRCLRPAPSPLAELLRTMPEGATVRLSGPGLMAAARSLVAGWIDLAGRLEAWREGEDMFEACGIEELLARIANGVWPLASGGRLTLGETRAATVIDVDSAAAAGGGARRRVDLEAADGIARLLRLAGIGGLAIVDFIDLPARRDRDTLLARLDAALARDPLPVTRSGIDRHGVLSLTRKRAGPCLRELLLEQAPARLSTESRALAAVRRALRLGRRETGPGALRIVADGDLLAWIRTAGLDHALAAACGREVRLQVDDAEGIGIAEP